MRYLRTIVPLCIALGLAAKAVGQPKPEAIQRDTGSDLLWKKLETRIDEIGRRLDGIMGVAILDLTDGRVLLRNADRVFPAASSIKIAILLELYRQDQEPRTGAKGKARLDDIYTFDPKDLVDTAAFYRRLRSDKRNFWGAHAPRVHVSAPSAKHSPVVLPESRI